MKKIIVICPETLKEIRNDIYNKILSKKGREKWKSKLDDQLKEVQRKKKYVKNYIRPTSLYFNEGEFENINETINEYLEANNTSMDCVVFLKIQWQNDKKITNEFAKNKLKEYGLINSKIENTFAKKFANFKGINRNLLFVIKKEKWSKTEIDSIDLNFLRKEKQNFCFDEYEIKILKK